MKKIIISIFMILIIGACGVITYTTINKSKKSIDELNDKIEQLEQENNTLKETIDDLESSNEDDETIKQLNTQITLLNNEINTLKETIEQLENDTENEDLIESLNNKIELLENEKDQLQNQVDQLVLEKEQLNNQITSLNNQIISLENECEELEKQTIQDKQSIESLNTQVSNLNNEITELEAEVESYKNSNQSSSNTITQLQNQVNSLTTQLNTLQSEYDNLENTNNQNVNKIIQLESEITELENQNNELTSNNESISEQLTELQNSYNNLLTENNNYKEQIISLNNQITDLENTISELEQEINDLSGVITTINITYELNGGVNDSNNITSFSSDMEEFTLLNATKDGYSFLGWYKENTFENKVTVINKYINSDITLYARFIENVYVSNTLNINNFNSQAATSNFEEYCGIVLYNTTPGSSLYWDKIAIVKNDGKYIISEIVASGNSTPTTYDYLLLSWSTTENPSSDAFKNCGAEVGDELQFSKDLTTLSNGEVDVDVNIIKKGGTFSLLTLNTNGGEVTYTDYYNSMEVYTLPTPLKEGYSFGGWYDNIELSGSIVTSIPAGSTGEKVYYAKWVEQSELDVFSYVSNPVTSTSKDVLPSELSGSTIEWSSSDSNLYTIKDGYGYTSRYYQTHKKQVVTITAVITTGGSSQTHTNEITINPVLYDEMSHPGAVYFSVSSTTSYMNNSERYQTEGTMFSEKFRQNMDMVYYAFAVPQSDGTLTLNTTYLETVKQLKNDGIRVLLVVDGANKAPLQAMVQLCNDDSTRAVFVNNILKLIEEHNLDGVDVDWEFPGTSGLDGYTTEIDQVNLNKLLRDLRSGLTAMQDEGGSDYILSVAIPATSWGSVRYDFEGDSTLGGINDYCDYVNMMSYDLNNTDYTTHVASHASSSANGDFKFGCMYGTDRFVSLGLSKDKIILGTAAYGKAYSITGTIDMTATYPGLGIAASLTQISGVTGSYASGTLYYTGVQQLINTEGYTVYTEMNGSNIVGSYLLNPTSKIYVTFDSKEAIKAKCEYANSNTGMGVMVWAYGEDATDTIVNTICDTLN